MSENNYAKTGRVTFCRPGKARYAGPNLNKQLRFKRNNENATLTKDVNALKHANDLTAQDIFERNYDKLAMIRLVRGEK